MHRFTYMNKKERIKHAINAFKNLELQSWQLDSLEIGQGGQSGACAVVDEDGNHGVFRCLPPDPEAVAIQRFQREISTVRSIDHQNVMKLLAWDDQGPYWYITRRGENLKDFWKSHLDQHRGDEERLVNDALSIIRGLADGIAACHRAGLVHRDIKPNNIVVYEGENGIVPVLIDFGIVWIPDEERLTDVGEAVGNARYAPDILRHRVEDCPSWVDVFSLIQVFQWMVAERDAKHYWQRPTHWRYLRYPEKCPGWFNEGLRALSAVTSVEQISPKDGNDLCKVIDTLFPIPSQNPNPSSMINEDHIHQGIAEGEQRKVIRKSCDIEEIDAAREFARLQLSLIKDIFRELEQHWTVVVETNREFNDLFAEQTDPHSEETFYAIRCHATSTAFFSMRMQVVAFVPSRWPNGGKPETLNSANIFACSLERTGYTTNFPSDSCLITLERDGTFMRRSKGWVEQLGAVSLNSIREILGKMLSDSAAWRAIAEL